MDYDYKDYRDAFLAILQGMLQHNGLNMADEGHYRAVISNASGMATVAAAHLRGLRSEWRLAGKSVTPDMGGSL